MTSPSTPSARSLAVAALVFGVAVSLLNPQQVSNWADGQTGARRDIARLWSEPVEAVSGALGLGEPRDAVADLIDTAPTLDTLPPATRPPESSTTISTTTSTPGATIAGPTSTTEPRPTPHVVASSDRPLRVMVIGDSLASDLALGLDRLWAADPLVDFSNEGKFGFGFAGTSFPQEVVIADWPQLIAAHQPDITLFIAGGNEFETVVDEAEPVGSVAWSRYIADYIDRVVPILAAGDARVYWLTMPTTRDDKYPDVVRLNQIFSDAAHDWGTEVTLVDTDVAVGGPNGAFDQDLRQTDDGIHFSTAGEDALAAYVAAILRSDGWLP